MPGVVHDVGGGATTHTSETTTMDGHPDDTGLKGLTASGPGRHRQGYGSANSENVGLVFQSPPPSAAFVSSGTIIPLSHSKSDFPPAVR